MGNIQKLIDPGPDPGPRIVKPVELWPRFFCVVNQLAPIVLGEHYNSNLAIFGVRGSIISTDFRGSINTSLIHFSVNCYKIYYRTLLIIKT